MADLALPAVGEVTAVGWRPPDNMTRDEWLDIGRGIRSVSEATAWVLGDWWREGSERKYGDGETLAAEVGVDYRHIRNLGVIAGRYELSLRNDNLTFDHHRVVAKLDDRHDWLDKASRNGWSVRQMMDAIREHDQTKKDAAAALEVGGVAEVVLGTIDDLELPDEPTVDLLLTDPPYGTDVDDITKFVGVWLPGAIAQVKPTGRAVIFHGRYPDEVKAYLEAADATGWEFELAVFHYPDTLGPSPKGRLKTTHQNVLILHGPDSGELHTDRLVDTQSCWVEAMNQEAGGRYFSWQKPRTLADRVLRIFTAAGDTVLDPFAGAGTFLVAAAAMGRHAVGCDIDPDRIADCEARGVTVVER